MKKIITLCSLLFALCAVCACTFQTKRRGYIFPEHLESEIAGVKNTAGLEDILGSPQVKTVYGSNVWVYYGTEENYHGPFASSYADKIVLLAWVDGTGQVTQKKILRGEELPNVEVADGETDIPAAIELNALQELFNNIGRFTPSGLGQ